MFPRFVELGNGVEIPRAGGAAPYIQRVCPVIVREDVAVVEFVGYGARDEGVGNPAARECADGHAEQEDDGKPVGAKARTFFHAGKSFAHAHGLTF